jgi:hypothetical protein
MNKKENDKRMNKMITKMKKKKKRMMTMNL